MTKPREKREKHAVTVMDAVPSSRLLESRLLYRVFYTVYYGQYTVLQLPGHVVSKRKYACFGDTLNIYTYEWYIRFCWIVKRGVTELSYVNTH